MPVPVTGSVVLDGITFTSNPITYEPLNWKPRRSFHMAIGGKKTTQDFGVYQQDDMIRLASGDKQFLDQNTVIALHTRFRTLGGTYTLTDWLNNSFTVVIANFVPVIYRPDLYRYQMDLVVTAIQKLWNVTYSGS